MSPQRRSVLRLAGLGLGTAIAGCLGDGNREGNGDRADNSDGTENGTENGDHPTIAAVETQPFVTHTNRPEWDVEGDLGGLALIDDRERQQTVLDGYEPSSEREAEIDAFIDGIDYDTERLLVIESSGPDACHDRLEVTETDLADGTLRGKAAVLDTGGDDVACATVVIYPSALVRITFEGRPAETAAFELTDGWGETVTVTDTTDSA